MSSNTLIYISLAIAVLSLGLGVYSVVAATKVRKWRKFFDNKEQAPENLDDIIEQIVEKIKELDDRSTQTTTMLGAVAKQLDTATQNVGIVRYNGNGDDGGNLSFSAALLDAHQSGILITSLHGRQQNRIYAKVVTDGASESTLSEEEKEALIQAITNTQKGNKKQ